MHCNPIDIYVCCACRFSGALIIIFCALPWLSGFITSAGETFTATNGFASWYSLSKQRIEGLPDNKFHLGSLQQCRNVQRLRKIFQFDKFNQRSHDCIVCPIIYFGNLTTLHFVLLNSRDHRSLFARFIVTMSLNWSFSVIATSSFHFFHCRAFIYAWGILKVNCKENIIKSEAHRSDSCRLPY